MEYTIGTLVFDGWKIIRELGEGANGKVFEIQKTDHGITAKSALKVIRVPRSVSDISAAYNDGMDEQSVTAYFQGFVDEIVHEIALMTTLKSHPNIVCYENHSILAHEGEIGWDILIKMELLTALPAYQRKHIFTRQESLRLGIEICRALAFCQKKGMIHRDIKPENIFISEFGTFKLGDFGVARTIEKTTGGLSKKGTESYMAPEVYHSQPYGASVDIYSIGLVLYKFFNNNRLPFFPPAPAPITFSDRENALIRRMQGEAIPAPSQAGKDLSAIILKACEYDPKKRYRTAAELLEALEAVSVSDFEPETAKTDSEDSEPEERTIGMYHELPEEQTMGMFEDVLQEQTIGMEAELPEEQTIGMMAELPEETSGKSDKTTEDKVTPESEQKNEKKKSGSKAGLAAGLFLAAAGIGAAAYLLYPKSYTLTVENGSGDGSYKAGEQVTITADEPEEGFFFCGWNVTNSSSEIPLDSDSPTAVFTMPKGEVSINAVYEPGYTLEVTGGTGSGNYRAGDTVTVTINESDAYDPRGAEPKMIFDKWEFSSANGEAEIPADIDLNQPSISFIMPEDNLQMFALYEEVYQLDINLSTEDNYNHKTAYYRPGTEITITAEAPDNSGEWEFHYWFVDVFTWTQSDYSVYVEDIFSETTTIIMPEITDDSVLNYMVNAEPVYYNSYGKEWGMAAQTLTGNPLLAAGCDLFSASLTEIQDALETCGYPSSINSSSTLSSGYDNPYTVRISDDSTMVSGNRIWRHISLKANDLETTATCPVTLPAGIQLGDSRAEILNKLQISQEAYDAALDDRNNVKGSYVYIYLSDIYRTLSVNETLTDFTSETEFIFNENDLLTEIIFYGYMIEQ